jgi:1-deoxy-D-xylulose-5-phosphate reductoisomerase
MARRAAFLRGDVMVAGKPAGQRDATPAAAPRSVTILGATGSIGASTLDLVTRNRDAFDVVALTANQNGEALARLARDLGAKLAVVAEPAAYQELKDALSGSGIEAAAGAAAVADAARRPAEWVMAAISGSAGLAPALAAVERGATVALANKECLVCAGDLFMRRVGAAGATLLPADSEHNAVFQALTAGHRDDVVKVTLTASGGPFRTWPIEKIRKAGLAEALKHPNWSMGPKITIDSATMMNKGLELIEAHHLFAVAPHELDVVVHPQSIVHGFVEFRDGSVVATLGEPDMRVPIAHCLAWPARMEGAARRLDLSRVGTLTFEAPDFERFPALGLAKQALETGGGAATVLNAANEVAVAEFIAGRLGFAGIPAMVEATLDAAARAGVMREPTTLEDALAVDHNSRLLARDLLPEIAVKAS